MENEQRNDRLATRGFRRMEVAGLDLSPKAQARHTPWGCVVIDYDDEKWIVQAHVSLDVGNGALLSEPRSYGETFDRFGLAVAVAHECAMVSGMVGLGALSEWLAEL